MSPTKHAWNMKNLEGTMAVEGMTVSEDIMDEQFLTYGTCSCMVANISYEQGEEIKEKLSDLAEGKTTSKIIVEELISKYKRAGA